MKSMMFKFKRWIHGFLFPGYEGDRKDLVHDVKFFRTRAAEYRKELDELKQTPTPEEMENLMRRSLGLPYINFHDIEPDGKGNDNPPHYLKGLDDQARKAYVAELAQIYKNDKFQAVVNYHINVLGNFSLQKAKDEDMRSGRIGIIALRGFRKEFEDANAEYQDTLKPEEEFDTHGILPE